MFYKNVPQFRSKGKKQSLWPPLPHNHDFFSVSWESPLKSAAANWYPAADGRDPAQIWEGLMSTVNAEVSQPRFLSCPSLPRGYCHSANQIDPTQIVWEVLSWFGLACPNSITKNQWRIKQYWGCREIFNSIMGKTRETSSKHTSHITKNITIRLQAEHAFQEQFSTSRVDQDSCEEEACQEPFWCS